MHSSSDTEVEYQVRRFVYDQILSAGQFPTIAGTADVLNHDPNTIRDAFRRLAVGRVLVLQENDEILMANPFSAVPTPFVVDSNHQSWWANCIWDALGIVALLGTDGTIRTSCADCGMAVQIDISNGRLPAMDGLVHIAVPARRWWENIVYT